MNSKNANVIKLKRLMLFFFASVSLLICGSLLNGNVSRDIIIIMVAGVLCGVVLLYDARDIDREAGFFKRTKQFFSYKSLAFFFLLLIALIPFAYLSLSHLSFFLFAFSGSLGILYSLSFKKNDMIFKLKNVLIIKNLLIGLAWGLLVIIGAGDLENQFSIIISIFAIVQVFLGSIIRDLSDRELDASRGVNSIPVIFGENRTILIMHIINIASLFILFFPQSNLNLMIFLLIIVAWRFFNLIGIKGNTHSVFWGQTVNLFTCCLFLIIALIQCAYGII